MEDNCSSRLSEAAAKTRKRRSSILKSQRPPRTPFSELEFNIATPTDTGKSRRVSFSKRTGVAEFVTNEATTTLKIFHEEHYKSIESSGNESEMNPLRAVMALGRRIFDQQFEEVEAGDLVTNMNKRSDLNIDNSMQNMHFAPLEHTTDTISAPQMKFEISNFTEHQSGIPTTDLALTGIGEMTDINFSNVRPLIEINDLDEIEKDIDRIPKNVIHQSPFDSQSMDYIEIDLNTTRIVMKNEESDMSITDSIHIPKVINVSKNISIDKKDSSKDWVIDKENIAINPYAAPKQSTNLAMGEETDKVLIFDGKRLTTQSECKDSRRNRDTMISNVDTTKSQRKTIALNLNDDLPNFAEDFQASEKENRFIIEENRIEERNMSSIPDKKIRSVIYDDGMDISMTHALPTNIMVNEERQKTIVFGDDTGNISMTQALSVDIHNLNKSNKRRTILFDNEANISLTQVVPSNVHVIVENKNSVEDMSMTQGLPTHFEAKTSDKRKMILCENSEDISITQPIQGKIWDLNSKEVINIIERPESSGALTMSDSVLSNTEKSMKRKSVINDYACSNISMTQALPSNIISTIQSELHEKMEIENEFDEFQSGFDKHKSDNSKDRIARNVTDSTNNKRRTIVFDNDANISLTAVIPSKVLLAVDNNKTIARDMSITQGLPLHIELNNSDKQKTIPYENVSRISITQPVVENTSILNSKEKVSNNKILENIGSLAMAESISNKKVLEKENTIRKSAACNYDNSNISMTQALPSNIKVISSGINESMNIGDKFSLSGLNHNSDNINMKVVDSLMGPINNKRQTIVFENDANISLTQVVPSNVLLEIQNNKTVFQDMSMTQALPTHIDTDISNKRKTMVFENNGDISMTQAVQEHIWPLICKEEVIKNEISENSRNIVVTESISHKIDENAVRRSTANDYGSCDVSMTQDLPLNIINAIKEEEKIKEEIKIEDNIVKSVLYNNESDNTKTRTVNALSESTTKRQAIYFESDAKISLTQVIPSNVLLPAESNETFIKDVCMTQESPSDVEVGKSTKKNTTLTTETVQENMCPLHSKEDMSKLTLCENSRNMTISQDIQRKILPQKSDAIRSSVVHDNFASSMTQTSPHSSINIIPCEIKERIHVENKFSQIPSGLYDHETEILKMKIANILTDSINNRRQSVVLENGANISLIQVSSNLLLAVENDKIAALDRSMIQDLSSQIEKSKLERGNTMLCDSNVEISMTNPIIEKPSPERSKEKMCRMVLPENSANATISQTIPSNILLQERDITRKSQFNAYDNSTTNMTQSLPSDVNAITCEIKGNINVENKCSQYQSELDEPDSMSMKIADNLIDPTKSKRRTIVFENDRSLTQLISSNVTQGIGNGETVAQEDYMSEMQSLNTEADKSNKRKTIVDVHSDEISMTDSIHENILAMHSKEKSKVTISEDSGYLPVTESISTNLLPERNILRKSAACDYVGSNEHASRLLSPTIVKAIPSELNNENDALKLTNKLTDSSFNKEESKEVSDDDENEAAIAKGFIANYENEAIEHALRSALKHSQPVVNYSDTNFVSANESLKDIPSTPTVETASMSGRVLVFDINNPLNNVLLPTVEDSEVHRYNPQKSTETLCSAGKPIPKEFSFCDVDKNDTDKEISTSKDNTHKDTEEGNAGTDIVADVQSKISDTSKSHSANESIYIKTIDVKDTQINTMVAMKETKYLLEANSSLTLVDDALVQSDFDMNVNENRNYDVTSNLSPMKLIFRNDLEENVRLRDVDCDLTSIDEELEQIKTVSKKRAAFTPEKFDKHKNCNLSSLDVTHKPVCKMQKISDSPIKLKHNNPQPIKIDSNVESGFEKETKSKTSPGKLNKSGRKASPKKTKNKKRETSVIVEQVLTEYNMQVDRHVESSNSESTVPNTVSVSELTARSDIISGSFTSSKNMNDICKHTESNIESNTASTVSRVTKNSNDECYPDLSNGSSRNMIVEYKSGVNVIEQIDKLTFMGKSEDCKWHSRSGDTWTFQLLHARLLLVVRLAPDHNSTRSHVSADTPVLSIAVNIAPYERKNSVAVVCVRFAALAMRHAAGVAGSVGVAGPAGVAGVAGEVPPLLGRCVGVGRTALQWGRAMHDARVHLAYSLTDDARLQLKVANVPLRSVWEVSMRLEMEEGAGLPWPRAQEPRVRSVMSDYAIQQEEVDRVLANNPKDWGHVPRAIWRIFKYLKHKTQVDNFLDM